MKQGKENFADDFSKNVTDKLSNSDIFKNLKTQYSQMKGDL